MDSECIRGIRSEVERTRWPQRLFTSTRAIPGRCTVPRFSHSAVPATPYLRQYDSAGWMCPAPRGQDGGRVPVSFGRVARDTLGAAVTGTSTYTRRRQIDKLHYIRPELHWRSLGSVIVISILMRLSATSRRIILSDTGILVLSALSVVALHTATNGEYGFHRDELATIDDACFLSWGYVVYPPVTPFH